MSDPEIDADLAYGEAYGASVLLAALMKSLVHKGVFSNAEVVDLIDQVLLGMEKLQGAKGAPTKAVERARRMLEHSQLPFSSPPQKG